MNAIYKRLGAVLTLTAVLFLGIIPMPQVRAAEEYILREEFAWVSMEDMLQGGWSASSLNPEDEIRGTSEGSAMTLCATGREISLMRALERTVDAGVYWFDFAYIQKDGGSFCWGFSRSGSEVAVMEQLADGGVAAAGSAVAATNGTVYLRMRVDFSAESVSLMVYNADGELLGESRMTADLSGGIDAFFLRFPETCPLGTGASFAYLYGWQDGGTARAVTLDENPMTGEEYSTIYEDTFGYGTVEELAAGGYTFSGKDADGALTVEDGYPKLIRRTADGETVTLEMPIPSAAETGYTLDGKIRASLTYELPTNQTMRVFQKWKSVDVDERITDTELTDGIMRRTRLYLRSASSTEWRVHTSNNNGGVRPLVMELDFNEGAKVVNAEMGIPGAANPTASKEMRTESEYNSNLYALEVELRGGSDGSVGNYFKVTTWKLEKMLEVREILTKAAAGVDLSGIAPDVQAVSEDLDLPTSDGELNLSWRSLNPEIISDSGQVMRPQDTDETVVMIMTAEYQGARIQRAVPVVVKALAPTKLYFAANNLSGWKTEGAGVISDGGIRVGGGSAALATPAIGYFRFGGKGEVQVELSSASDAKIALCCEAAEAAALRLSELGVNDGARHTLRFAVDTKRDNVTVYADGTEKATVPLTADYLTGITVTSGDVFWVTNGMAWIAYGNLPESLLESLRWEQLSADAPSGVYKNLTLPESPVPMVQLSFASDNGAIDDNGTVTRSGEDVSGAVTVTAALTDDAQTSFRKAFPVTVAKRNLNNETPGSTMSTTVQAVAGSSLDDLADDDPTTAFQTQGAERSLMLQFDLGEVKTIGSVTIQEHSGTITSIRVETAEDNEYQTVYEGSPEDLQISISKGRYVRVYIQKEAGALQLAEVTIESGYSDAQAVAEDMRMLALPDVTALTESFTVPEMGALGSTITLVSGGNAITITKSAGIYTITPLPQTATESVSIGITVQKNGAKLTKTVSYVVRGTGSGGAGGGGGGVSGGSGGLGGGGGGLSGSSGGAYQAQAYPGNAEVTAPEVKPSQGFSDVPEAYWARTYIDALCEDGILAGFEDGTFRPEESVTREQFVKMLVCAIFPQAQAEASLAFADVPTDAWYYPYVSAGTALGIVRGTSDTMFGTGASITREDLAVMAERALRAKGIRLSAETALTFADAQDIADYAKQAVAALCGQGIIQGDESGRFAPGEYATRAEAAKIIFMIQEL